jgi:hypothetical protein
MRAQVLPNEVLSPTEVLSPEHIAARSAADRGVADQGAGDEGQADTGVASSDGGMASLARFAASDGTNLPAGPSSSARQSSAGGLGLKNSAPPKCLLSESVHNGDGSGPVVALDEYSGKLLVVTLGITDVVERTGLTVSLWGSSDQIEWGATPLLTFRQRQYCGVYSVLLNLAAHPGIRYLRVQWNMNRWGKGERKPLFGFEVFLEESGARVSTSAVA